MAYLGNDLQVAFPVYRNIDDISGSFNSSTTSFPLRVSGVAPVPAPLYSQQCLISVGGVVQRPDDSGSEGFRLSGGNIIFASAPTTGADFFGVILAGADYINAGGNFPSGTAAVPSITFNDDLDTGIYNSGINQVSITTGGSERLRIDSAGQIESVSLGTAAAPAFSFTTDPNSGLYSPGADQVAISTGGSDRLFVDASGNVGVGATPTSLGTSVRTLEIKGAATNRSGGLSLTSSDNSANAFFYTFDNVSYLGTTATPLSFFTNNTERLRVTAAGLVGVGTSSPAYRLNIAVASDASLATGADGFLINTLDASSIARPMGLLRTGSSYSYLGVGANRNCLYSNGTLAIQSDSAGIEFATGNSLKAVLDSSGRLGIGTSSPNGRLDVADGDAYITKNSGGDAPGVTSQSLYIRTQSGNLARLYSVSQGSGGPNGFGGDFRIQTKVDNGALVDRFIVNYLGNVGIGTTSANSTLDIKQTGNTYTDGIAIQAASGTARRLYIGVDHATGEGAIGTDTNDLRLEAAGARSVTFKTNGSERGRWDSSGRLLVGTSSTSATLTALLQGNSSSATSSAGLLLARGEEPAADGTVLGALDYSANNHVLAARILCKRDGGTWTAGTSQPTRLEFSTTADGASSPTERMRITNAGRIETFCTTVTGLGVGTSQAASTTDYLLYTAINRTGIFSGGGVTFGVFPNGDVQNFNNSYGAISDIKLKENIVDAASQWGDIKALQVRNYNFKEGQTHTQIGLVAQEVELVSPGLVSESPDRDAEGNDLGTVTKSVNYSVLYMKAVKALQEAMERIELLEARLDAANL